MAERPPNPSGGEIVADRLVHHGVRFLFALCGGHISPILVAAKARGVRVVDTRHEATAVFAADAIARLSGVPGVAAVTAGPGVTNAITGLKNAQLAQVPLLLLGGATATLLRGRGALQDIDQLALVRPHVKLARRLTQVREIAPAIDEALALARDGVPGPVFLELPVDLLYPEALVRGWYGTKGAEPRGLAAKLRALYVSQHVARLFRGAPAATVGGASAAAAGVSAAGPRPAESTPHTPPVDAQLRLAAARLARARRPLLLVGSQALAEPAGAQALAYALRRLGIPVYLSGMARGLLGAGEALQLRHRRKEALREADLVVLAGVACDFRLDYGRQIGRHTELIAINRSRRDARLNRRPTLAAIGDPADFLRALASRSGPPPPAWREWLAALKRRESEREAEIEAQANTPAAAGVNAIALCRAIDGLLADDATVVADGGDFVATASYVLRPRAPLGWLDPGPFGTLGVGAGFALAAKLLRPQADVWLLFGDGALGYGLVEVDTFARHGLPVVVVVGNDAGWSQIARDQVELLGDPVGTVLAPTDYAAAAVALGARGWSLRTGEAGALATALSEARNEARAGRVAFLDAHLGPSDFRKGSLSI